MAHKSWKARKKSKQGKATRKKPIPKPTALITINSTERATQLLDLQDIHDQHRDLLQHYHNEPPVTELWKLRAIKLRLVLSTPLSPGSCGT